MSDGIFEFMDSQEVMDAVHNLVSKGHSPNEAAKHLVKEARRWVSPGREGAAMLIGGSCSVCLPRPTAKDQQTTSSSLQT